MSQTIYYVTAFYDEDCGRWVATSDDVPGLVCECDTYQELKQTVKSLTPELLFLNEGIEVGPFHINMTTQTPLLVDLPMAAE